MAIAKIAMNAKNIALLTHRIVTVFATVLNASVARPNTPMPAAMA